MDAGAISELGHHTARVIRGLDAHRAHLERTPATWADVLLDRVACAFDFATADVLITRLDRAVEDGHGDERFVMEGDTHTLAGLRTHLREVMDSLNEFRNVQESKDDE